MADKVRRFAVTFEPDEGGWHVSIPSVRGCVTWGRSLEAARRYIREALATCVDVLGPDAETIARSAELSERFKLPPALRAKLSEYRRTQRAADRADAALRKTTRQAAAALTGKARISLRDAGALLGLSHERLRQLASSRP
jgi:predicted RNase H-like HicB family nuclease